MYLFLVKFTFFFRVLRDLLTHLTFALALVIKSSNVPSNILARASSPIDLKYIFAWIIYRLAGSLLSDLFALVINCILRVSYQVDLILVHLKPLSVGVPYR